MDSKRKVIFWLALLSFMAAVMGVFAYTQYRRMQLREEYQLSCTILKNPRPLSAFKLTDINNQPATAKSLQGRWTFLFFGFTRCHMICPTTMAELAKMFKVLNDNEVKQLPRVVMVSIDPRSDVPQVLKTYVQSFNRDFTGLTGNKTEIQHLTKQLGIAVLKAKNDQFDHSGTIVLLNPKGEVFAFFSMPHQAKTMAADYQTILRRYS